MEQSKNNHIRIAVEDDGVGFDLSGYKANFTDDKRFGLFSIQERISDLGGELKIETAPGKGTKVIFQAPLELEL